MRMGRKGKREDRMGLNELEQDAMYGVLTVASSLSLIGCIATIFLIVVFERHRVAHIRIILFMMVAAAGKSASTLMGDVRDHPVLCDVQAFTTQFFDWATMIYTCCISFNVYQVIVNKNLEVGKFEGWYHAVSWLVALLFACLPLIDDHYGESGPWCWITRERDGDLWRFLLFYVPLIIFFVYILVTYILIVRAVKKDPDVSVHRSFRERDSGIKEVELQVLRRLRAYPLVFLLIWTFPLVNRMNDWINPGKPSLFLVFAHACTAPLQGFAYSLVYGLDSDTMSRMRYFSVYLERCCKPTSGRNQAQAFVFEDDESEDSGVVE
eukprot:TRINITY_DN5075_c0_g1_i4.p1 TRINITY_DN5075_c0_g1~~TRINITY_DN5075_c0_g1_i4.p1  ORF type:complete len:323 (-),score=61.33 TRINITY_DN5075_c0_g1_i4:60-1028(-)